MKFDVTVLPSFTQVEAWRKRKAREERAGLFAQTVTTFDAWIADLWELHGDGRTIVDDAQREILMGIALDALPGADAMAGLVPTAASCMRIAAGLREFDDALESAKEGREIPSVSHNEHALLRVLASYENLLEQYGLIEQGRACALLAGNGESVFPAPLNVLMPASAPLTPMQRQFFASCAHIRLVHEPAVGIDGIVRAPEGREVRFAFPSGKLAEPGLVADIIRSQSTQGDIVIACKNPAWLYEHIQGELAHDGLTICLQTSKPFSETDFGRTFLAHYHMQHDDVFDPALVSDALLSPFSGISRDEALRVDASLRADRIVQRDDALLQINALSEPFSHMAELASDPDADVLLGVFEHMAQSMTYRTDAWRTEQLAAMGAFRRVTTAARSVHADIDVCARVLERGSVPISLQATPMPQQHDDASKLNASSQSPSSIIVTTQSKAAQLSAECCSTLIVADLTSEEYPVADRDDAVSTLFGKLSIPANESALSRARREFCALLQLATHRIYLVRPLGDANADETYPSVVLEEFIDAYRDDPSATDDIDNPYRLPKQLQEGLIERGEERLFANARAAEAEGQQRMTSVAPAPRIDDLTVETIPMVRPAKHDAQGHRLPPTCPSPSQVEVYLECPYQWFAARRLRIGELDEGFGPLERGTFAHAALETFYRRFRETGHAKVDEQNLEEARAVMRSVTHELAGAQPMLDPLSGRLVATSQLEQREINSLCNQLVAYLDFEARLLPTFHPEHLEFTIAPSDNVEYAGLPFTGRVDRIDTDDAGHAVIIDYKGSVNAEHCIAEKTRQHPGKMQTRIYARAVERALGVQVVGVLYVSYGRGFGLAGAYDPRILDAAHLPYMNHEKCSCIAHDDPENEFEEPAFDTMSFADMLGVTEEIAIDAIARMNAGDIAPNPSYAKACEFCPVLACPKRGA